MIQIGDKLPDFNFTVPGPDGLKQMSTDQVFGGKTVALFAVPGAFTPTCSARHLPSFRDKAGELAAKVDASIERHRAEGEALHKAGKHQESVDTLAKAMKILNIQ